MFSSRANPPITAFVGFVLPLIIRSKSSGSIPKLYAELDDEPIPGPM
jgi:hypothetical protein